MTASATHAVLPAPSALRLARRFEYANRLRAFRELTPRRRHLLMIASVALLIATLVVGYQVCRGTAWLLALLRTHWPAVVVVAALIARSQIARSRRRAEHRFRTSWLAVTPIAPRDVSAMVRRNVLVPFVAGLGTAMVFVGAAGVVNESATGGVAAALLAGSLAGALAGWWSGGRLPRIATESDVRIGRLRDERAAPIGLAALGRWPFAERFANLRPRVDARVFGTALLSLPMGIPPFVAVLLLLALAVAVAAASLLKAQLGVVPRADDWLRSTPLALNDFAVASSARGLAWQCAYAIAMGLLLAALGARPMVIVASVAGWIAWVAVSMLTAFACRHRPRQVRTELLVLGVTLAALATVAPPAVLVAAAAAAIVQWKRAAAA